MNVAHRPWGSRLNLPIAALLAVTLATLVVAPTATAQSAPYRPVSVSVPRAGDTLTATWDAPTGATKYHVTYSADGGSTWASAAGPGDGHSAATIDITGIDTTKIYIVGVRAGNEHGWSSWRNSAPQGPDAPPARPEYVGVARADGTLTTSWNAVSGADRYHVTYSSTGGESWSLAASDHTSTSITLGVDNHSTYIVGVRAGMSSGDDTLWSGWRNSPSRGPHAPPPPPPAAPASVTLDRSCDRFVFNWTPVSGATGYDVNCSKSNRKSWTRTLTDVPQTAWKFPTWNDPRPTPWPCAPATQAA